MNYCTNYCDGNSYCSDTPCGIHPFSEHPSYSGRFLAERIFRGFLFLGRRIFPRIFSPDLFSSFLWEKVPREILQEIPGKILPKLYNKNPRDISAEGPGQQLSAEVRNFDFSLIPFNTRVYESSEMGENARQCNFRSAAVRKLQRNFCFRLWHVAGVGFRGVGFRTS